MLKHIFDNNHKLIKIEEIIPKCGEDFCDTCGDCLHCYWELDCISKDKLHFWVEYEDK